MPPLMIIYSYIVAPLQSIIVSNFDYIDVLAFLLLRIMIICRWRWSTSRRYSLATIYYCITALICNSVQQRLFIGNKLRFWQVAFCGHLIVLLNRNNVGGIICVTFYDTFANRESGSLCLYVI